VSALSSLYASASRLRRSWYARPSVHRRLGRPVVSVGNLVVGGSGKTPIVAALAHLLLAWGETPAILTRGYARRRHVEGVLVVSDGTRVRCDVEESSDEPLMLARALPSVPVLVSPDRYLAGRLAERTFGATVMLLDDGFQHLQLARDVDLLVMAPSDLAERVLPAGRLREPLSAASFAHAVLVYGSDVDAHRVQAATGVQAAFTVGRHYGAPSAIQAAGLPPLEGRRRVLAVAGIARPERFFAAVIENGFEVAGEITFRDHHWYTHQDVSRIADRARVLNVDLIVTTEKDAVRVERLLSADSRPRWAALPMRAVIEPADAFASWLQSRLRAHELSSR
jgi:tetraacyldisaccharide 4'-kinase